MGLDMYMFRFKKLTEKDAEWLTGKSQDEIENRGYTVFGLDDIELYNSILPYGQKIKARCKYVDWKRIKKDNNLSENARIVGMCTSYDGVSYSLRDEDTTDIKKIRIPKDIYETVKDKIECDVETKRQFDIPCGYVFLGKRRYRENMVLTFVRECEKDISLTNEQYETYIFEQLDDVWVFEKDEVGYWRKAYDLQDMIYEAFNSQIENCGYYVVPDDLLEKINQYQEAHNYSTWFYELPDDECYVYHEWY